MAKPKQLFWIGDRDADGRPLEFFGGMPGVYDPIPARDLSEEETAALTEAQLACIDSPTGKRLYRRTDPADSQSKETRARAAHNQENQEVDPSSLIEDSRELPDTEDQHGATTAREGT